MSWIDLLHRMRSVLSHKGFDQIPQLSSSRMLDVNDPFEIVPRSSQGRRRVSYTKTADIICTSGSYVSFNLIGVGSSYMI